MVDEIPDELKQAIANDYKEIEERKKISDIAEKHNVSEATIHKYKNFEKPPEENPKNFEEDFKPEKKEEKEEEEEEEEEEEHETAELVF